ncbi:hypothetical protein EX30DRAFT_205213 [Ascodesmis nigricans]|uniref:Uncharacterized protein n=1 Tax=Ascodesmis nigricans TaxID=341454 RepID=A0A4S2MR60_9PEZI|nr:hypothetical protein EX30DRAFT_205213 [Ascodesmis nigricans]
MTTHPQHVVAEFFINLWVPHHIRAEGQVLEERQACACPRQSRKIDSTRISSTASCLLFATFMDPLSSYNHPSARLPSMERNSTSITSRIKKDYDGTIRLTAGDSLLWWLLHRARFTRYHHQCFPCQVLQLHQWQTKHDSKIQNERISKHNIAEICFFTVLQSSRGAAEFFQTSQLIRTTQNTCQHPFRLGESFPTSHSY